ncbi:MAG: GIY-YIG nuclease family protein [Nanoarchaeota archaeon]
MNIDIPDIEDFEKIKVRNNESREYLPKKFTNLADNIPKASGIYIIIKNNKVLYVGKAKNLKTRFQRHLPKYQDIEDILFLKVENKNHRDFLELAYQYHFFKKTETIHTFRSNFY